MSSRDISGVILAAGKGSRMKSDKPKVLYTLLGAPMLWFVLQAVLSCVDKEHLWTVLGHKSGQVLAQFPELADNSVIQYEQLGTGHAVQCCYPLLKQTNTDWCLIVNGDIPLITPLILDNFIAACIRNHASIGFLTIELRDPQGYGRVLRFRDGTIHSIIEEKDITDPEKEKIREVNAGVYLISIQTLAKYLDLLGNNNKQNEYCLPELIDIASYKRENVYAYCAGNNPVLLGINSPNELVYCEEVLKKKRIEQLGNQGVIIRNPEVVRIDPRSSIERDVEITGPVEIYGDSRIASQTRIDSHVFISNSRLGSGCRIKSFSHLEDACLEMNCEIGPYARIRPQTQLENDVKVGNFVEVKKSLLKKGSKANHLAYLGDAQVGESSNIGAGTITCNYDGQKKHKSIIGNRSLIGSNTSLVAPVELGDDTLIGAGSTITRDVPDNMLAVARSKQKNLSKKYIVKNRED